MSLGKFLLTHGAGAGIDHPFMQQVKSLLEDKGFEVIMFEFPYMVKRREDGKKRPPDRAPKLVEFFNTVIEEHRVVGEPLYIGGKSMGGRIATMVADDNNVSGCFAFGYPFHPPGKPDTLRTEHLEQIASPIHIFQGTRDAMGTVEEVSGYTLSHDLCIHWLEDGNHDLKPRVASGFTQEEHLITAVNIIEEIVKNGV